MSRKGILKLLPSTMLCIIPCAQVISGCSAFVVDPEIAAHDENSWQHAIEYISNCKHPTIYVTWNASYLYQQAANLYFASSQKAIQTGHTYLDEEYKYQDQIFLASFDVWHYKENQPGPTPGSFALKFNTLIDENLGYSDILARSTAIGKQAPDLGNGNNMLITNLQDFNCQLGEYNTLLPDYVPYDPNNKTNIAFLLNKIFDLYEKEDKNIKFNIVINDFNWRSLFQVSKYDKNVLDSIIRIFNKVDKFYLLSEGGYTYHIENQDYFDYRIRNGYVTSKQQENVWKNITSSNNEIARQYCYLTDYFYFYNNEKYFYHFSASSTATYAPCLLDPKSFLTKETTYKFSSPWFVPGTYKQVLGEGTNFNNYLESYLTFFRYEYNETSQPKFDTLCDQATIQNFDASKRNLIFLLPKAFLHKECEEQIFTECNKILQKIEINFPKEQWNYIYKAHPAMKFSEVEDVVKKIWNKEVLPTNTLIINPIYPFEYLATLDQWMVDSDVEESYHLIDPNTLSDDKPSGVFVSFDMLSTAIYATMSMFVHEYNKTWNDVKHLVNPQSFYIPRKFSIWSYEYSKNHDFSDENIAALWRSYKPLCQNGEFPDINIFEKI
ncbi:MAG: hypothetical protein ACOQNV_02475 [Mycoplasmoidaceae bacterium]